MKTILFPHKPDLGNEQKYSEEVHKALNPFPHEVNITDGGEFLDDCIRMKDQPFREATAKENV